MWVKVILGSPVLFMPAVVTSVGSEVDCVVETPFVDNSITDLLTPVTDTVNYIQYKETLKTIEHNC